MRNVKQYSMIILLYVVVIAVFLGVTTVGNRAITAVSEAIPIQRSYCVIIDPGHGGEDGGAVSVSGLPESSYNLDISLRLNDLFCLMGYDTKMLRTTDRSVYTQGNSLAEKKVSDLRERASVVNSTENGILISIHQNNFSDERYSGAQVFYGKQDNSKALAIQIQTKLVETVNQGSNRKIKSADGIYLMQHVECPAVLVECGFLSNPQEEALLRSPEYQKKLICVIAAATLEFLDRNEIG